jgi:hypothetical protein
MEMIPRNGKNMERQRRLSLMKAPLYPFDVAVLPELIHSLAKARPFALGVTVSSGP